VRPLQLRPEPLAQATTALVQRLQVGLDNRSHGWWPDGWAAPVARLVLPREGDGVEIEGSVPPLPALEAGQRLRVVCNGAVIDEVQLPPGRFRLVAPVPSNGISPLRLRLEASRWTRRGRGDGHDRRRLAYLLSSVRCVTGAVPEHEVLVDARPSGWYQDGWASTTVTLWLRGAGDAIVVRGRLPDEYARIRDQELRLRCHGRGPQTVRLRPGPFELTIPASNGLAIPASNGTPLVRLDVTARRFFVPYDEGLGSDRRRLAFLLTGVELLPHAPARPKRSHGSGNGGGRAQLLPPARD
jgi:hypothetical protein